jgi:hypothetical protein
MILPKIRDMRFITIRLGGVLTDEHHHLLTLWAAECAQHVLHIFEVACPNDNRPRQAIEAAHAWVHGEIKMMQARDYAGAAGDAARRTNSARRLTRYGQLWQPYRKRSDKRRDLPNLIGNASDCLLKFGNSCLKICGLGTIFVGMCLTSRKKRSCEAIKSGVPILEQIKESEERRC